MAEITNYIRKEGLPGDLLGNLEMVTLNAGSSFLKGEATNIFSQVDNIIDDSLLTFNTVTDLDLIKKITVDLGQHCLTVATGAITSYLSDRFMDLIDVSAITDKVLQSVGYWTQEKIMKPAELLSAITEKPKVEQKSKKLLNEEQEKKLNDIKDKITGGYGKCMEFKDQVLGSLEAGIGTITAYVKMGPDWVVTQANSYTNLIVQKANGFIGSYAYFLENMRDSAIESLGCAIGTAAAETTNAALKLVLKKVESEKEQLAALVQVKAQNVIAKAVMIVRQLTGIAIPPIFPPMPKLTDLF